MPVSYFWLASGALVIVTLTIGSAKACDDYYVCAPDNPWRHTVESANFTNLYLHAHPDQASWDQHLRHFANNNYATLTIDAIDAFVAELTNSSYFYSATQYHRINPPRFSGHQTTHHECADPVTAYATGHNNIISHDVLSDFVGCERRIGGNPSDQVNVILSPAFRATNNPTYLGLTFGSTEPLCTNNVVAFHTWRLDAPNFTVIPTQCNTTLDELAASISHEMIEMIANPAGMGYMHVEGGRDQLIEIARGNYQILNTGELADICERGGFKNPTGDPGITLVRLPLSGLTVSRYWSNIDNRCEPQSITTDTLVDDRSRYRMGTGGNDAKPDLVYDAPFRTVNGEQLVKQLLLYSLTADDNLCNQSNLYFQVDLNNGNAPLVFHHINRVQYADSWDNNEVHTVNITVPDGLTLSEIAGFRLHVQSGHCNPLAGLDRWNVSRIAVEANLIPEQFISAPLLRGNLIPIFPLVP